MTLAMQQRDHGSCPSAWQVSGTGVVGLAKTRRHTEALGMCAE
jgi:hypothetical protein